MSPPQWPPQELTLRIKHFPSWVSSVPVPSSRQLEPGRRLSHRADERDESSELAVVWEQPPAALTPAPASGAGLGPEEVLSGAAEQSSFLRGSAHIWEWSPLSQSAGPSPSPLCFSHTCRQRPPGMDCPLSWWLPGKAVSAHLLLRLSPAQSALAARKVVGFRAPKPAPC